MVSLAFLHMSLLKLPNLLRSPTSGRGWTGGCPEPGIPPVNSHQVKTPKEYKSARSSCAMPPNTSRRAKLGRFAKVAGGNPVKTPASGAQ